MNIRKMTYCALFAALLAVCGWLRIPVGDGAVTLQTLGVFLALGLLGGSGGCWAVFIYLGLGAVGLPVFSGFQGGFAVLLGPTGGYLWGFLIGGLVFRLTEKYLPLWANLVLCQLICYGCGVFWYCMAYAQGGLWGILVKTLLPYLLPDGIKLALALFLIRKMPVLDRLSHFW